MYYFIYLIIYILTVHLSFIIIILMPEFLANNLVLIILESTGLCIVNNYKIILF